MAPPAPFARPVVIKARPDTLALVAIATAMTFALSYTIHANPEANLDPAQPATAQARQQAWAGGLSELAKASSVDAEPLTSASLVVPKSVLALPAVTVRPLVRLRGCEGSVCAAIAKTSVPTPLRRPVGVAENSLRRSGAHRDKQDLMARLNPLRHLPDMQAIGKPFTYAGNAVTGWFRSF